MSQIHNVITTEFRAKGTQATAEMGSVAGGFMNIGRQINDTTRLSERLNQQFRAIGTTIRYSIAGAAVFGLRGIVTQLKEIQVQAGLISAIGTIRGPGGQPMSITGGNLSNLMNQARQGAVQSLTPLQDYNDAVINLLSTVQNVPEDQITPMVTMIAQAAKLSQINAEDATKAFTSMNVAFGKPTNLGNVRRTAQEFFILTQQAPGGRAAGGQIIGQLGQLAAITRLAGGTQEDIFSLALSGLRGGIPPSQLGRGLQYMIQTVALPGQQSKESQAALRSIGITPSSSLTLQQRLTRVFARGQQLGGFRKSDINKLASLDDDTIAQLESAGDMGQSLQTVGVSGPAAQFYGKIFHRVHALRTAAAIAQQVNVGQAQKDLNTMLDAANGHVADVNKLSKAWDRLSSQAKLEQATIAVDAMGQQIATVFAPILNFPAKGLVGLQGLMSRHQHDTATASWAAGAGLLGLGTASFLGFGPGRLLRGFFGAKAGLAMATGGGGKTVLTGLGSSPDQAMYVYVVNTLGGLGAGGGGAGAAAEGAVVARAGVRTALGKGGQAIVGRAVTSGGLRVGLGAAGAGAAGLLAVPLLEAGMAGFHPLPAEVQRRIFDYAQSSPEAAAKFARKEGVRGLSAGMISRIMRANAQGGGPHFVQGMFGGVGSAQRAEQIRNEFNPRDPTHITKLFRTAFENINGKAYVTLDVNLQHPGGRIERKKVVIPIDLWSGGRNPTTKGGKKGNRK